jgi:superfamily II DNA or RNA helicase/HKD family nuclease
VATLVPRWSTDPVSDDGVVLPPEEYQLLLADHAQRVAGEWARALRLGDAKEAAHCVSQLRALAAAGLAHDNSPVTLDAESRAIQSGSANAVRLFTGTSPSLWDGLCAAGQGARQVEIVVAYAQPRGVRLLMPWLKSVAQDGSPVRLLVGTYLNGTSVDALRMLLDLTQTTPSIEVRLLSDPTVHFHPKIYRIVDARDRVHLFVGSSNLSHSALTGRSANEPAIEWNLAIDDATAPAVVHSASARLEDVFATVGEPLTDTLIAAYDAQRPRALPPAALFEDEPPALDRPDPRPAQEQALKALAQLRKQGYRRALVVAATGLGKTVLAALDSLAAAPGPNDRVLFLAHRETLLTQARDTFAQVRPDERCGLVVNGVCERDAKHLFVSIASAKHIDPSVFQYVVVDEAHHSAATSYRKIFDQLPSSAFVLGLTATPDRLDGGDIYELFDNVVAYEVGVLDAIGKKWLVPFHYFGLRDSLEFDQRDLRQFAPRELENKVLANERMSRVLNALQNPKYPGQRTLAFCVSIRHAQQVAARLIEANIPAAAVHSGPSSIEPATAITRLRSGALKVLCVVDMFNEGVDIPEVDRVALLRPTDSPIVFLQQLGRGLRTADGKTALVVIDFVANHRRAELRPEWLGVAPSDIIATPSGIAYEKSFADGRTVSFEPAVIDVLRVLGRARFSLRDRLRDTFDRLRAESTESGRPSYSAFLARCGLAHGTMRSLFGSWFMFLKDRCALTTADEQLLQSTEAMALLEAIEATKMSGPHKMLLLGALTEAATPRCTLDEAAERFMRFTNTRHPSVLALAKSDEPLSSTPTTPRKLLLSTAVKFLPASAPKQFRHDPAHDTFEMVMPKDVAEAVVLEAVKELAEARLFDFLRRRPSDATEAVGRIVMNKREKDSTLFLNVDKHRERLPKAAAGEKGVWIELHIGAERLYGWLVEIAINRIYRSAEFAVENLATEVLRTLVDADTVAEAAGRFVRLRPVGSSETAFELLPT